MSRTTLRAKASEYSQAHFKRLTHTRDRMIAEKAFLDGLRAFKEVLDAEAERLTDAIERGVRSEFEKGQMDGILWLRDASELELGFER
jgi:hypothetical protein